MNITVLGSGGWGTALGLLLLENGHHVTLWSAFAQESDRLRQTRENPLLPGVVLPEDLVCTAELSSVATADMVVLATPSFAVRETAGKLKGLLRPAAPVVIVSKGIERDTLKTFTDVVQDVLGPDAKIAALSGPSHAEEVSRGIPTACVAAAEDLVVAEMVQDAFMNQRFRVYTSTDVIGVELGAALKNVIAMGAGVSVGMGYGDNTIAALMTRGLSEMADLATAMGGHRETLSGLAGLGDLIVTCTSPHSRNRRAGVFIGKGLDVQAAMEQAGGVVEGYYAVAAAMELAKQTGVDMPVSSELYQVLYEGKELQSVLPNLMARSRRSEELPDTR